jgi:uncharacterized protein YdeI (YjbR/CyaY-like superfamily)
VAGPLHPTHFASAADFRRWLAKHHATARELLLGFHKKASGRGGLTYPEAVDELLCFGWIDGVKRRVDQASYTHRITPRRPRSVWSLVNVGHARRLIKAGRMHPAGLAAFKARTKEKTGVYSFESRPQEFTAELARIFRAAPAAWVFFSAQSPGYRRTTIFWVTSAKQPATRESRLARLITLSAAGRRLL